MGTELEITLPDEVPVMTLPNIAFFPQALLPLHVFEPRYRTMLVEVLASNRLMAVAGIDPRGIVADEPICKVAGVGIVRACQGKEDGTSDLLIQGLCRVEVVGVAAEKPFRRIQIRALASEPGAGKAENQRLREELARLLRLKAKLSTSNGEELNRFLKTIDDPETFVDIAAFSLCENPQLKQKLLETLDVHRRMGLFSQQLRSEISSLRLQKQLQGEISDEKIGEN
ncbi:MAG TPA: LON peptidase substrate-binding domain-containing protein [Opitutaceae bacterium]|jgi:ATP-dependent Lon protease